MLRVQGDQFGTILTCYSMDGQAHMIGKAIEDPFSQIRSHLI